MTWFRRNKEVVCNDSACWTAMAPAKPVKFSSVEFRDGQQSLFATRMRTEDMLPILEKMDQVGYESMEMWGGATFDSCIRFLGEDPWERLRRFKCHVKNTPLRMLLRGQNILGYQQYPDDIVERFVYAAAGAGVDIFLIFDGLNDVRNTETAIKAVKKCGKRADGNILFTASPVHSIESYVHVAKKYVVLGVEAIHIEDMAGMIDPVTVAKAIRALKAAVPVPVHFHAHCTGGMADIAYWEAVKAGVDVIDVDVSALSLGTSHPPAESLVVALRNTPYDTKLDLGLLAEINSYFLELRKKYKEHQSAFTGVDISVLTHQIPGGMLSNLESQLKQMNMLERIDEVLAEVANVRKDLGYPPLGTPFSQIVGVQSTMNVMFGERYKMMPTETKEYIRGKYGKTPGEIAPPLIEKVLGGEKPMTVRPADLLEPGYEKARLEIGSLARTEEDILTYALFGAVAIDYLRKKYEIGWEGYYETT